MGNRVKLPGTIAVCFIIRFGVVNAVVNLHSSAMAGHYGGKSLLVLGWLIAPLSAIYDHPAPGKGWIVTATILRQHSVERI